MTVIETADRFVLASEGISFPRDKKKEERFFRDLKDYLLHIRADPGMPLITDRIAYPHLGCYEIVCILQKMKEDKNEVEHCFDRRR